MKKCLYEYKGGWSIFANTEKGFNLETANGVLWTEHNEDGFWLHSTRDAPNFVQKRMIEIGNKLWKERTGK